MYLTAEERRYIFNALLAYRNKLLAQGRYTDLVDEVMIKLQNEPVTLTNAKRGVRYKHCPLKVWVLETA